MKRFSFSAAIFALISMIFWATQASTQTVTFNDGTILQNATNRVGLNIGTVNYYDNGQILKNLVGATNPGFEPLMDRQVWSLPVAGTTTSFFIPNVYDTVPANYWAGATFTVVESQSGGAELGCTGTVASNTGPNYPVSIAAWIDPIITVSSACAAPFSVGDIIVMTKSTYPTPESWWETGGRGGITGSISGGAQLLSDTTDLCSTCGSQALNLNASVSGSVAGIKSWYDSSTSTNLYVLMNGTFQLSFWAKAASGSPSLTASALRLSSNGFNCGTYTPKLTQTWTLYTYNCTASETVTSVTPSTAQVAFQVTGGSVYLDNISFAKTSSSINNPTVLRDEVIETLQNYYGSTAAGPAGMLRDWLNQNGETLDNWIQPSYAHAPATGGVNYFVGPGGYGSVGLSLEDYLVICQFLNAEPYLEVPPTFSTTEAANLIEFLASSSGTTYGSKRAALGQTEPWTSVFDKIHLSFCNECWNNATFSGGSLGDRTNQPNSEYYYDYSVRARDIFAAMRGDSNYSASSFDLTMNAQTAVNYSMDTAIKRAKPDSIEIEDYTMSTVNNTSDTSMWGAAFVEPYLKVSSASDPKNFHASVLDYQSQKTCGASGTAACNVNIYEWGQGTISGSIDQKHIDYVNAGAGEGIVMALQPLLNIQYFGIKAQQFFAFAEYQNPINSGLMTKLWGNVVDMGGSTNNVRPTFLGVSLVNQSIIGPMFSCPIANGPTYNFAASTNGNPSTPAMTNIPSLYAFCFENGSKRSIVLVNTDMTNSRTISFAGSNTPTGSVTQRQYAPTSLDALNEAPSGSNSFGVAAAVGIETSSLSNPASITIPPTSVTALDYTAQAMPVASTPTFSPGSGTYTAAQSVTIQATAGATVYVTTDGSTPTTTSPTYSGPITVKSNMTLGAISVASGYAASAVAMSSYVIAPPLSTPTFSVASGTYTTAQKVTISESVAGSSIYYTTDGSTPSTSSTVYSGPITVSGNETINALAAKSGYSNSPVGSASYVFKLTLPAPTLSVTTGTYASTQTVTISDSTPGATIYYTVNGLTPTTLSTLYTGPITVNVSQTLQAIAVEAGYTTSAVATAAYNISGSNNLISIASGGFVASSFKLNQGAAVSAGILKVTDGGTNENRTAWYQTPLPVGQFVTEFRFQQLNANADGMTFTIQNNSATASGSLGGGLGYQGITNSVAVKFDLFNNAGEGSNSTGIYTNGASPTIPAVNLTPTGVNLHSGDIMDARLVYDGTNLTMTLTDTVTYASAVEVFPVNIPSIVGSNTAYVGFTGGTGSVTSTQQVLGWVYAQPAGATITASSPVTSPTFSPAGGAYTSAQSVTISDSLSGATIYYTTNGTTPTTSSAKYTSAITVSASATVQAIAVKSGYTNSPVTAATYTIGTLNTGSFSYPSNAFTSSGLALNNGASVTGGVLQITDGGTIENRSAWYSAPVSVASFVTDFTFQQLNPVADGMTFTVQRQGTTAVGLSGGGLGYQGIPSSVAVKFDLHNNAGEGSNSTGFYTEGAAPTVPSISLASTGISLQSGHVMAAHLVYDGTTLTMTLTDTVTAAVVTESTTINIPSVVGSSTAYIGFTGGTGSGTVTQQILSWTYVNTSGSTTTKTAAAPTFTPAAGTYTTAQSVKLSDTTAGATIYYTTNGSTPTTSSTKYSGALKVSASETLKAIAVLSGYNNSTVATASYAIAPILPAPAFSLASGTYTSARTVKISDSKAGATIYFTTNGSTPTTSSTMYTQPVAISATEALKAIAAKTGYTNSPVTAANYTITPTLPSPTFSVSGGTYTSSRSVTIADSQPGATIYYTTNGTTPTTTSTKYSGSISVSTSKTLKAIAMKTGYNSSSVASVSYVIAPVIPTPKFSVASGTYTTTRSVTISDAQAGVTIYYTTNGATPTASATKYTAAISVSTSNTLKAVAIAKGYTNSSVGEASYTIAPVLPTPTLSTASGTYTTERTITIKDAKAGTTIYYTTNGTTPTTSSTKYTGPVTISTSKTLKAIASATGYTTSAVASAVYTIAPVLPAPTFSTGSGTYTTGRTVTISDAKPGTTIYYTTNGTTPIGTSSKYTGPVAISTSKTLKAIAVATGYTNSSVTTAAYVISKD